MKQKRANLLRNPNKTGLVGGQFYLLVPKIFEQKRLPRSSEDLNLKGLLSNGRNIITRLSSLHDEVGMLTRLPNIVIFEWQPWKDVTGGRSRGRHFEKEADTEGVKEWGSEGYSRQKCEQRELLWSYYLQPIREWRGGDAMWGGGKRRGREGWAREEDDRPEKKIIFEVEFFFSNVLYKNNKNTSYLYFIFLTFHQTPGLVIIFRIFLFFDKIVQTSTTKGLIRVFLVFKIWDRTMPKPFQRKKERRLK